MRGAVMRICARFFVAFFCFMVLRASICSGSEVADQPLIGPVVFHWFGVGKDGKWGQYQTPWPAFEGREKWTAR